MRTIEADRIGETVYGLILKASYEIGEDVLCALQAAREKESSALGCSILDQILENDRIAGSEHIAICQDTGVCVIFMDIGQDVHIAGGDLSETLCSAVRRAYTDGYLRKSMVSDPLYDRLNTEDNTPPVVHTRIVPGEKIDITVIPKGFGSENASAVRMLAPAAGEAGVIDFVAEAVQSKGANACPPLIIGVGIGGTMESAAIMAKRMTARPLNIWNADPRYRTLEQKILHRVNALGIGPAGVGGNCTALKVNIETAPTHIAGMPVAVNICCHAARHAHAVL
ncbi:MAG: fumarate hydratase [Clostridia bacterium]|nr:fumarate hydratase [Clostridia bacterium]